MGGMKIEIKEHCGLLASPISAQLLYTSGVANSVTCSSRLPENDQLFASKDARTTDRNVNGKYKNINAN